MNPSESQPAIGRKRVFLVDDHPMVRERLAQLIDQQPDLLVCGEASDAAEALQAITNEEPDIAIVDLTLKSSNGLELVKNLKAHGSKTPVLVLSMHDESLYAERVLRAGAMGYVSKQESTRTILAAIRRVIEGGVHVSPALAGVLVKRMIGGLHEKDTSPVARLADRELEVFQLIGRGLTTRKIAENLNLSVKTVESYRSRIKEKLQIDDGVQLLQRAVQWVEGYQDGKSRSP
jgi:DNA-binding NarL/FixJ family response regulator